MKAGYNCCAVARSGEQEALRSKASGGDFDAKRECSAVKAMKEDLARFRPDSSTSKKSFSALGGGTATPRGA